MLFVTEKYSQAILPIVIAKWDEYAFAIEASPDTDLPES